MKYHPYIICTTPRSGSFFLCDLLKRTGVAGNPHEYLTKQTIHHFMEKWGVYDVTEYIHHIPRKTSSENGVYGVKVMWGLLPDLCTEITGQDICRESAIGAMLNDLFPEGKYIFLQRENTVRQAISLYKAANTGVWAVRNEKHEKTSRKSPKPRYDFYVLERNVRQFQEDNQAWDHFFSVNHITPLSLTYEECAANPQTAVNKIIDFLGIDIKEATSVQSTMKKQSDWLNRYWYYRYCAENKIRNWI